MSNHRKAVPVVVAQERQQQYEMPAPNAVALTPAGPMAVHVTELLCDPRELQSAFSENVPVIEEVRAPGIGNGIPVLNRNTMMPVLPPAGFVAAKPHTGELVEDDEPKANNEPVEIDIYDAPVEGLCDECSGYDECQHMNSLNQFIHPALIKSGKDVYDQIANSENPDKMMLLNTFKTLRKNNAHIGRTLMEAQMAFISSLLEYNAQVAMVSAVNATADVKEKMYRLLDKNDN